MKYMKRLILFIPALLIMSYVMFNNYFLLRRVDIRKISKWFYEKCEFKF